MRLNNKSIVYARRKPARKKGVHKCKDGNRVRKKVNGLYRNVDSASKWGHFAELMDSVDEKKYIYIFVIKV